jgi:hypothetical protein
MMLTYMPNFSEVGWVAFQLVMFWGLANIVVDKVCWIKSDFSYWMKIWRFSFLGWHWQLKPPFDKNIHLCIILYDIKGNLSNGDGNIPTNYVVQERDLIGPRLASCNELL